MKVTLDVTTLSNIKAFFNPVDNFNNLSYYNREEMQQVLIISAFVDYLKSKGQLQDVQIEVKLK
jgi:hypothetical protein